jgi:hypothetical protein
LGRSTPGAGSHFHLASQRAAAGGDPVA